MKKPISNQKYQELYTETAKLRILQVLFTFPDKEFSLSDLAKEANVAKANIGVILKEFQSLGLVEISKLNVIWRIKANKLNPAFIKLKIPYNLSMIYNSGIIEFLNEYYGNTKAIILFGSYRKGDDISDSDIDMAVEVESLPHNYKKNYIVIELEKLARSKGEAVKIKELQFILRRRIQVHVFNRKDIDLNLFNNLANGIVLDGFLEVKP